MSSSYVAPAGDTVNFSIPDIEYTAPDHLSVNFTFIEAVYSVGACEMVIYGASEGAAPVQGEGAATLFDAIADGIAFPCGAGSYAKAFFTAHGTMTMGAVGTGAGQLVLRTSDGNGLVVPFGSGLAAMVLSGSGGGGLGSAGQGSAQVRMLAQAIGETDMNYYGNAIAQMRLAGYAVGTVPQAEVCA